MSVTVTQNPGTYSIVRTLADYNIHHSDEAQNSDVSAEPNPHPAPEGTNEYIPGWETEYRRVPPHRPVNTELDFQSRNTTQNGAETFFLYNMFGGIRWVSYVNRAWRATGGRINDGIFKYKIGGEW